MSAPLTRQGSSTAISGSTPVTFSTRSADPWPARAASAGTTPSSYQVIRRRPSRSEGGGHRRTARRKVGVGETLHPTSELGATRLGPATLTSQLPLAVVVEAQIVQRYRLLPPHGRPVDVDEPFRVGGLDDLGRPVGASAVAEIVQPSPVVRAEMGVAQRPEPRLDLGQ